MQMNGLGTEGEPGTLRVLRIIWVKRLSIILCTQQFSSRAFVATRDD